MIAKETGKQSRLRRLKRTARARRTKNAGSVSPSLLMSEGRYRRIVETVTDFIVTVSFSDGAVLTSFSPLCEIVTGYTNEEFRSRPELWLNIVHDDDRVAVVRHRDILLRGEEAGPLQFRIWCKNGSFRWLNVLPVLHRTRKEDPSSCDLLVRDITDRQLAAEALRQSETRFREMADLLPQPVYESDADGIVTFTNRAGFGQFGYSQGDLGRGICLLDLIAPEDRGKMRRHIVRTLAGGRPGADEYTALRKDGRTFPILLSSAPILRRGVPAGLRGTIVDITDRVLTEQRLRENEQKFRQLAEAIREVFWITDMTTRTILYVSPAYEEIFGRTCRSLYERPRSFLDHVHPEDRERVRTAFRHMFAGGSFDEEYRIVQPDDSLRWIRARTFPVRNASGSTYRIVGVAEDVTERKAAEQALQEHAEQLRTLSSRLIDVREEERRSIARELHDEIGQLATGLKMGLDLLAKAGGDLIADPTAGIRMLAAELIERVRTMSLGLRPTMLDDQGLLPALEWHFRRYESQSGIRVRFSHDGLDRRFPAAVETALYRIAQEALTNVARHAGADAVEVSIVRSARGLCLRISDAGCGFYVNRLSKTASVGLFGMQERAESLGGHLIIRSALGEGTVLLAQIPLAADGAEGEEHGRVRYACR